MTARIVVKIGTSSLTDERGGVDDDAIAKLSAEVADVRAAGDEVVVVSSGAVAAGVAALGFDARPGDVATLHARLRKAALQVCSQLDSRVLGLREQYETCVSGAVTQSVAKVDNARLTSFHRFGRKAAAVASND